MGDYQNQSNGGYNQTPPPYGNNGGYNNGGYNNGGYNNGGYNNGGYNGFNENEYYGRNNAFDSDAMGKSRGIAGLLAILIGTLGIQYFYLGKATAGILTILLSVVTCGAWGIITLIQGILMFTMTNADFDRKFVYSQSTFPIF